MNWWIDETPYPGPEYETPFSPLGVSNLTVTGVKRPYEYEPGQLYRNRNGDILGVILAVNHNTQTITLQTQGFAR